jgi:lipopolysaccharide/colanic/teichoic acid biosynthesis glycosyltransferase
MTLNDLVELISKNKSKEENYTEHIMVDETIIIQEETNNNLDTKKQSITNKILNIISDSIYIKRAIGQNGREINVYKFRTMIKNADKQLSQVLTTTNLDHQGKLINDSRITKLGKILRKYHLDELPQLYNILKGDMKLVGIRPMEKEFWDKIYPEPIYNEAIKHKPGLWGVNYAASKKRSSNNTHLALVKLYQREYKKSPIITDTKFLIAGIYNKFKGEHSK